MVKVKGDELPVTLAKGAGGTAGGNTQVSFALINNMLLGNTPN